MFSYKISFASVSQLCGNINMKLEDLKAAVIRIDELNPRINEKFEELKKLRPEFSKMKVHVAKLKEYKPQIQDMYEEKREDVLKINHSIQNDVNEILSKSDDIVKDLKKINMDANKLLYKENKVLNEFAKKIKDLQGDEKLRTALRNKINEVKEDMKSITRELYEAVRAEKDNVFDKAAVKTAERIIPMSEQIKQLSIDIYSVGTALEKLNLDDINDITKDSENELADLNRIQLDVVAIIRKLGDYLKDLKHNLYLLEDDVKKKVKDRFGSSDKKFADVKKSLTKNAKKLFEEIKITPK